MSTSLVPRLDFASPIYAKGQSEIGIPEMVHQNVLANIINRDASHSK
jgi:hypothetical protein